ncbi:hypothetical protein [Fischerella sp. PCC 9605]|uniref:hypothetical protein n=1 Tax=Fischerella sp. PCC 9605 TaxID=1173024 RepID=UPI0004B3723C|nr:hypothetical protein [Fischerella sp. PCC 9605]
MARPRKKASKSSSLAEPTIAEKEVENGSAITTTAIVEAEVVDTPLSAEERERLLALEREVVESFLTAARALREIRDRRLYRESYPNFEEYCEARFGYGKRLAYYYIDAANVADNLEGSEQIVHVLPTSESQVRPLKGLAPDAQRLVWSKAVEKAQGKAPSINVVRETLKEFVGDEANTEAPKPLKAGMVCLVRRSSDSLLLDRTGYWAIVKEVSGTVCTVELYDRTVEDVPTMDLTPLSFTDKEARDQAKLLTRLSLLRDELPKERVSVLLLRHFATLKDKPSPLERNLLAFLERKGKLKGEAVSGE